MTPQAKRLTPERKVYKRKTRRIIWKNTVYWSVTKFDGIVIDLNFRYGGGYFTVLPISDKEYRKTNFTPASISVVNKGIHTVFNIVDDWNHKHTLSIHNSLVGEIKESLNGCLDNELITLQDYTQYINSLK